MKIINKTPHVVKLLDKYGRVIQVFKSVKEEAVRLKEKIEKIGNYDYIPIYRREMTGETINLPEEKPDTKYIVSMIVKVKNEHRKDLLVPYGIERNEDGGAIGCKSFSI